MTDSIWLPVTHFCLCDKKNYSITNHGEKIDSFHKPFMLKYYIKSEQLDALLRNWMLLGDFFRLTGVLFYAGKGMILASN